MSMTPERATPHGRIITMRVTGTEGSTLVSGSSLQRAMDLKSTRFQVVSPDGGTTFQVIGGGFGHGIGMSQWGALGLARAGYNYQQILAHYYRNTTLAKIQPR
ncbi:MAG: hypothetical protein HC925_04380 [Coleofasciculaceae cyanobacterium SM2_3_26]|nr:hypothetical protein [Coleofasciculaceae cyanobacterium SM2_3_26]